jgi:hypothetical protein
VPERRKPGDHCQLSTLPESGNLDTLIRPQAEPCVAVVAVDFTTDANWAARHEQMLTRFGARFTCDVAFPPGGTALVRGRSTDEVEGGVDHLTWAVSTLIADVRIGVSCIGADGDRDNLVAEARRAALYASFNLSSSPATVIDHPMMETVLADPKLQSTAGSVLDPLDKHPEFLCTLYLYIAFDRDRQRIARHLRVHPRTVDYRLRRIAALTGLQPQTIAGACRLLIALICRLDRDIAGRA